MQTVCYSKGDWLESTYPEFLHIKDEDRLDIKDAYLLVLDISAFKSSVEEFLLYMENFSTCKGVFILSMNPNFEEGRYLLTLGIKGYGNLYMQKVHMYDALESIRRGNIWLYPLFIQQMIESYTQKTFIEKEAMLELLSPREKEIATLVKEGFSNKEIGKRLGITERTAKAHLTSIYNKLDVKDRVALVIKLSTKVQ